MSRWRCLIVVALLLVSPMAGSWRGTDDAGTDERMEQDQGFDDSTPPALSVDLDMDGCFVENLGQVADGNIRLYAAGDPLSIGLMDDGVVFCHSTMARETSGTSVFTMRFGSCNDVRPRGARALSHPSSFFVGRDPDKWVREARSYREVVYEDLYDGVDLRLYFRDGRFKYDFVLMAGMSPDAIVLCYEGVRGLDVDALTGDLLIDLGAVTLRDQRPYAYQDLEGGRTLVECDFRVVGGDRVAFDVGLHSPSAPLVIDPGLDYSTYLGGGASDGTSDTIQGDDGSVYLVGYTFSDDFPTSQGAYCSTVTTEGAKHVIVCKFSEDPFEPVYVARFGSPTSQVVNVYGCALLSGDRVCIIGGTTATDFPITVDAMRSELDGSAEGFLTVLSSDGTDLTYSTYVGGNGGDWLYRMIVRDDGSIYLSGSTDSTDLPTTPGAFCATSSGGYQNFVMRLGSTLDRVISCTYLFKNTVASFPELMLSPDGSLYLMGSARSDGFPTTPGAFCTTRPGMDDAYLMKMRPDLTGLEFSTLLGGAADDWYYQAMLMDDGSVLLGGVTNSTDFPITEGAIKNTSEGDYLTDIFISRLDATGSTLLASTYLGGSLDDEFLEMGVLADGDLYVTGYGISTDLPTTPDAICGTLDEYGEDGFFIELNTALTRIDFATYFFGHTGMSAFTPMLWASDDTFFIGGAFHSWDDLRLPVTHGCFDRRPRGETDGFVMGINLTSRSISYCTYLGGCEDDYVKHLQMTPDGRLVVMFSTVSRDIPTTSDAYQRTYSGGYMDIYVGCIDPTSCDVPYAPENLRATGARDTVALSWDAPRFRNSMVSSHRIYRGTSVDNMTFLAELEYSNSTAGYLSYGDYDVIPGIDYYYRITAVNGGGESGMSLPTMAMPFGLPQPPINLTATTGDSRVHLSWGPPVTSGGFSVEAYKVYKGDTRDDLMHLKTVTGGNVTLMVDGDVNIGQFYYYAVSVVTAAGEGPTCEVVRVRPLNVPSSPPGFGVEEGDGFVRLSWGFPSKDGGSMIIGFRVLRSSGGGAMELIATLTPDKLAYRDTDVVNGVQYTYHVLAYSEVGDGSPTTSLDATPRGPPSAVEGLKATAGDGTVALAWDPPASDGGSPVNKYVIAWGTDPGNLDQETVLGAVTTFAHTGLVNGQTYHYQVRARSAAGDGPVSTVVAATPMGLPGAVRDLQVMVVPAGVRLTWSRPLETGGATSLTYKVLRGTTDDPRDVVGGVTDKYEFLDVDVVQGTTYFYRVLTSSSMGDGPLEDPMEVTAAGVPGMVTGVTAVAGDGRVTLTWTAPVDGSSPITHYVILRGLFETGLSELARVDGAVLNFTDDGAENGRTHHYRVYALNAVGPGPQSDTVSAKPLGPPGAPGVLEARVKGKAIVLSWTAPTAGNTAPVTGYKVYRGEEEGALELLVELGDVLTYTDRDVKVGRPYYYKVVATSGSGESEMSRLADAKVLKEEEPGFGAALAVMAVVAMVVLVSRRRR